MQKDILPIINESNRNLFILGKAGVGKSTLIKVVKKHLGRKCIILCPTGIAAQNVKGVTIHSFFGLPHVDTFTARAINNCATRLSAPENLTRLREIETIIIDEISMVNSMVFDAMDKILQAAIGNALPFGGKRMILIGDIFQLPPIDNGNKRGDEIFFWRSAAFSKVRFQRLELKKVHRLTDSKLNTEFEKILGKLRVYRTTQIDLDFLNNYFAPAQNLNETTILCTLKRDVEKYNIQGLEKLGRHIYTFLAEKSNGFPEKELPVFDELKISIGAPIIFVRNDAGGMYKNGTRGKVLAINKEDRQITVLTEERKEVKIGYVEWVPTRNNDTNNIQKNRYFRHFPLLLGFAMTIHRCQGMTLSKVHLDLAQGTFAPGQMYVALSRLKNVSGLSLARKLRFSDLIESQETNRFYNEINFEEVNLNISGAELSTVDTHKEVLRTVQGSQLNSKDLSIQLFNQGLDIEEILEERSRLGYREILPQTVKGHLVDGFEEVDLDELKDLLCISEELEEEISEELYEIENIEELTWTDIRNALSYDELDWNTLKLITYLHGFRTPIIRSSASITEQEEEPIGEIDTDLFKLLKAHRWNVANDQGIELFQVFHNSSLEEMATKKPTTDLEFLSIYGVGPVKLKQYGDSFLQVIRDYLIEESSVGYESSAYDHALFEKLRSLRNTIAKERSLPAYYIFKDDSLNEMATSKPKTSNEFLRISGVGQAKLEEYGDAFVACIRLYLKNM
jgi:hypothetical protein